jgi:adenosylmethionine-8-amino-7-oxononanoate aminotransferase
LAPPKEYWEILRKIFSNYGIILIIDEVICGFGRTGKWFGIEHFGIQPDILTMAKGISNGYVPLGAVGCTDKIMEPIEIFHHLHTYGNHPVSCAAALKNIEIMKRENLIENSFQMGIYFLEKLKTLEYHPIVDEVRGSGLWTAIDLTTDKKKRLLFPGDHLIRIIDRAKGKGLIIKTMGHALEFAPPLIIRKDEIDRAVRILDECLTKEEKEMGL